MVCSSRGVLSLRGNQHPQNYCLSRFFIALTLHFEEVVLSLAPIVALQSTFLLERICRTDILTALRCHSEVQALILSPLVTAGVPNMEKALAGVGQVLPKVSCIWVDAVQILG